jgi:hypothetical protein
MKKSKSSTVDRVSRSQKYKEVPLCARATTVGELISAAYDTLGDARTVVRVLGSKTFARTVGRKLVIT